MECTNFSEVVVSARIVKRLQIQHLHGVVNLFMKLAIGRNPSCLSEAEVATPSTTARRQKNGV
jgi:hypothetical protein